MISNSSTAPSSLQPNLRPQTGAGGSSMSQQQTPHPSAMMSQSVPSSTPSNLSPTQSISSVQGRLQSQSQLDSMRSMSQQPGAVSNWSTGSYYAQPPSQSPYSNVMNPYMPYSASSAVPNHTPPVGPLNTRPTMGTQKTSANNSERGHSAYPPHATSIYGQPPPPPTGGTNGSYYGYDSYYSQVANQASSDPYLTHPSSAGGAVPGASSHWPSSNNQMISNSSSTAGSLQPPLMSQTGSNSSNIHPQSPSASSNQMISNSSTAPGSLQPNLRSQTGTGGSSMSQQQTPHPSAMMSQSVPSSTPSNLSPTQSISSVQGRLQSQSQLDSMRSMSQQPGAVSNWSTGSYYARPPNQSPYSNVMNPYMPYSAPSAVPNHTPPVGPLNTRPTMGTQKTSANNSERGHSAYPPHATSIYGQPPPPPTGGTNSSYYGYDSYYSQVASQASSDPYLTHPSSAGGAVPGASSHWPSSNNQMISNSSSTAGSLQPPLMSQTGSNSSNIHPQSPSASSSLPPLSSRQPPPSQTPDRSPVPQQHSTSYPSPNQQASAKSTSNSLAQLEQMVMPSSAQGAQAIKSPTLRSSASSPGAANTQQQQQLQYSYNSSGQGSYFSTGSGATPNQTSYYPQYESSGVEMQKPGWTDQGPTNSGHINSSGPILMESGQSSYGQPSYDGAYPDYTSLSAPSNSLSQPRFSTPGDTNEPHPSDKGDPYAIDSQTFDDYEDQSSASKTKKGRAKKGDDKTKKERKPRAPRAPRAPKTSAAGTQPQSPSANSSLQALQTKPPPPPTPSSSQQLPQTLEMSPVQPLSTSSNSFPCPNQQGPAIKPLTESPALMEPMVMSNSSPNVATPSKSPAHRLSTESPNPNSQQQQQQQPMQYGLFNFIDEDLFDPQYCEVNRVLAVNEVEEMVPDVEKGGEKIEDDKAEEIRPLKIDTEETSQTGDNLTPLEDKINEAISETTADVEPSPILEDMPSKEIPKVSDDTFEDPSEMQIEDVAKVIAKVSDEIPKDEAKVGDTKSKRVRAKKSDDKAKRGEEKVKKGEEKVKKERKPRAAKNSKAGSSLSYPMAEDTIDAHTSQPAVESIPVVESTPAIESTSATESTTVIETTPATETTPAEPKPKRIRVRDSSAKGKKKLPKFALKFAKTKKRKRLGSSDNDQSDLDKTPPPSPDEVESGVQKRRSARNTKKLKYNDDIALGFSDSDDGSQTLAKSKKAANATIDGDSTALDDSVVADEPTVFAAPVEDTMVVEKIMATRTGQRELEPEPGEVLPPDGTHIEVEEFYVKYKNLSYLHCDWRTLEELEKGDRRIAQKIKRYKQKKDSSSLFSFMDEEPFDPQYCEVDRILAVNEVEEMVPDGEDDGVKSTEDKTDETLPIKMDTDETSDKIDNITPPEDQRDKVIEALSKTTINEEEDNVADDATNKLVSEVSCETTEESLEKLSERPSDDRPEEPIAVDDTRKDDAKVDDIVNIDTNLDSTKSKAKIETSEAPPEIVDTAIVLPKCAEKMEEPKQVVEEKPKKMKKKISRHYLVKWRGLSYEESTWELEDDLDPEKIKQFERFKDPPPKSKWRSVKRPKPEEWVRKENSPVYKNNNTLREYQLEGINWLSFCWHQGRNCILADEMGLGKTIQSIAFVNEIYQYGINGPFLIIVPLSTVGNWAREFETWTDLNVITYHGSSTSREMLKEYEMFYRNEQGNRITSYYKFQVMITTFEIILSDCLDLREIPWRCCIIDEAHRLKNRNCKLLEGLRLLNMEHRVLLTGTPLQNNVEELFSLLNFLEPNQFSSTEQFLQEFGDLKTEAQVDKLKLILKPMMLRRLKEDVEKSLAPKEETIVEVELTNIQKKYYRAILEKNFSFLSKGSSNNNMPNLMNTMMELRKCCIHPYLINGAEEQIMYEARQSKLAGGEPMSSHQAMVNSSGKLVLIDKLLPRLRADGHRVLIFSQMVRCLDILEDYVTHKHYPFERIDGRVRGGDRQQAIDRFSKPGSDRFVFLLCTRAGGLGINLTAADTVIIFDSDWNPQNDLQAQARCHRIGQSKAVKIYRLICRNTYEREMFDKASLKLGLDKAVLQSMNTQKGGAGGLDGQLTKKEIEELLRKGAYGALMDDDNAGDKFCEEDIDQILQRRTQVITIDNSEAKGSTFSKATFSSSNNREDIELDDPNFWEKWAKKANIDSDDMRSKDELIQLAPRRRTQTKRYGADGNLLDISDLDSSEEDEETISMRTRGSRGRQPKMTPTSNSKRSKRNRQFEFEDDEFLASLEADYLSKGDCLKVEKGLLTYGWGRWEEIIASNRFKRELTVEECENICRVILLYCLNNYKGDEKIKSFAWEIITPEDDTSRSQSDLESSLSTRGRKTKITPTKKTIAEEIADAKWTKEAKYDPLIALPDDQYRRHLQRNSNRLLIRVKFLHYLKNDILKEYLEKILTDAHFNDIDLPPVPVDGELPAAWWDDDADKSLLIGIFKHGHDKFNLMRQDPNLCFLQRCGPPNKEDLMAEMNCIDKGVEDLDDENREGPLSGPGVRESIKIIKALGKDSLDLKDSDAGEFLDSLVDNVVKDLSANQDTDSDSKDVVDENKNSILKSTHDNSTDDSCANGVNETSLITKMDITDDESLTNEASINPTATIAMTPTEGAPALVTITGELGEFELFPSANDLNQRFRRLITAYQRNSKKLEIKLAQKARDELKKERTSKFEAAKNEREERKRSLAQKWSRREEADFFRAISSFGVEYDSNQKKHDWNRFRSIGKLEKKLDETLEEYYKAFVIMCKKVTSRPLTADEEKCPINVDTITEERASRCLSRIEFLNKVRENIITNPELDERLKLCQAQSDLPDWWENGKHDKDLLLAAAKHGLTRLDYNLAHDSTLVFDSLIKQKAENFFNQPPTSILIPLEQLQDLLEKNGIEYLKDLDLQDDSEDIKAILTCIIDSIESEDSSPDTGSKSFAELVDGPHSKSSDESAEKSLLANSGSQASKIPTKTTRSSSNLTNLSSTRALPNIIARRGANTAVKSGDSTGPNLSVRLTSIGQSYRVDDRRVAEITPIMPDKIPEEPMKSFEAGEISMTIQSESALLHLDDRSPIVLFGAKNPISAKIRWPKDKAIQTRLENLVALVEKNEWPSPPKPLVPTITLPSHMTPTVPPAPLTVVTSSPAKNDKADVSLGSPRSDISNISSRTSKQDTKERYNDLTTSTRGRRGRGRRLRQPEPEPAPLEVEPPKEDRQAAAKLRNLLSQGPTSTRASNSSSSSDKLTAKFRDNKQGAGLSSLLASFKQKRTEGSGSSHGRDDKNILDLNAPGTANLLPQILANMKPEFRDLLANQDAATMLLNSLTGMTGGGSGSSGGGNVGANLRSSSSSAQISIDNLLNATRSTKGPPPAHQRTDNPPSAHGSSSSRELRRNSQSTRENSPPPSINLRSTRGKGSLANIDSVSHQKPLEMAHAKMSSSKRRGRPSSSASDSPPGVPGADVLDLSSLPISSKSGSTSRSESRSTRRHRDHSEDLQATTRSSTGVPTKAILKAGSKQQSHPPLEQEPQSPEKGVRTTRASKRIGSRIDALALNLQAKKLHRSDSPSADLPTSLPRDKTQDSPVAAHGSSSKSSGEHKSQSSKAPPAAHSGHHKRSSGSQQESSGDASASRRSSSSLLAQQVPTTQQANQVQASSASTSNQSTLPNAATLNLANQFGSLNSLGGLLNFPGMNELMKQMSTFPGLAGSLPRVSNAPVVTNSTPATNTSIRSNNDKGSRRSRHSSGTPTSQTSTAVSASSQQQAANAALANSIMNLASQRSSGSQQESSGDASASRRSSSSLLAQQVPTTQQANQVQASSASTSNQSTLPNAATLNLANQFGSLNSLGGLLNFPGMNELMKQMSTFPGLAGSLPRVSNAPVVTNSTPATNTSIRSNNDKGSRRSRHSSGTPTSQTSTAVSASSQQQAANAALANSIMNLASQPNAASNPYSNYPNPLANPFLPFSLANLGMNNPLSNPLGLFPNLYMPPGFPTPDPQQPQSSNQSSGGSGSGSKDKKMRYPRK